MILVGLVFLMLTAAADSQDIRVTETGVTLTCEGDEGPWTWKKGKDELKTKTEKDATVSVDQGGMVNGEFSCEHKHDSKTITNFFYVNVKVCDNCYEMSGLMATGVILGDLLLTGAVILIVYMCVRKNTGSTQHKASKPRTTSAPPVPNPDYERLNQHTVSSSLYAGLKP